MNVDFNVIITGVATGILAPIAILVVKTLLDFKLAPFFVKYFSWIPVRSMFRNNPDNISGQWEQTWDPADSENFADQNSRHGNTTIRQFGTYCYCEFPAKGVTYVIFGRVVNDYFVGDWYDKSDAHGYFGAFQLQIVNSKLMKGKWIGHSKTKHEVRCDEWKWNKL